MPPLHARAEAFPLGLGVLTGKGVTTWRRTLADLIPAATPPATPAYPAGGPGLPAATRELIGILAAMTLAPAR
jgi:hypothetical protein